MITTSRYASEETRKLAARLAKERDELLVSRGKRTVAALVEMARRRGEHSISIIEELEGRPYKIALIKVSETGEWEWSGEERL